MSTQRFIYKGQPVYNRFNLMSDIAGRFELQQGDYPFDIVLETVETLERLGIIETIEGSELFKVQNWEKIGI